MSVNIIYKHRHFINLGVGLTWATADIQGRWYFVAPSFCGSHDQYSRKKAREIGIERLLKYQQYTVFAHTMHALEMLNDVVPRNHKSHKWIKEFVLTLLNAKRQTLVSVQRTRQQITTVLENMAHEGTAPKNMYISEKTIEEVEKELPF